MGPILMAVLGTLAAVILAATLGGFVWILRQHRLAISDLTALVKAFHGTILELKALLSASYSSSNSLTEAINSHAAETKLSSEAAGKHRLEFSEEMAQVPKMLNGLVGVTKAHLEQLIKVERVVEKLHGTMFSGDGGSSFVQPGPEEKSRAYEIAQLIRTGMSQAEAEERAGQRSDALWDNFGVER